MDEILAFLARYGTIVVFLWVLADWLGLPIPVLPVLLAAGDGSRRATRILAHRRTGGAGNCSWSDPFEGQSNYIASDGIHPCSNNQPSSFVLAGAIRITH